MARTFSRYNVKKTDKPFLLPNGEALPQTAAVSLLRENGEVISTLELGVVDPEKLYEQIAQRQAVNLDKCYIENFSMAVFREKRGIKNSQFLDLNEFIATNSVFHSKGDIDLSFTRFSAGEIDLSSSLFLGGNINFTHADFGDGELKFDNAHFHEGGAIFSNASFGKGLLSFKNSRFTAPGKEARPERRKREGSSRSGRIILNFEEASFWDGKIDFTRSNLGSGEINFSNARLSNRGLLFVSAEFHTVRLAFKSAHFKNGKLDFRFANFERGTLLFDRAFFDNSIIDFSATEFQSGKISFNRTEFEKNELIFEASEIKNGRVTFKNNIFGAGVIDFSSAQYRSSGVLFENVDFGKCTASFSKARVQELSFRSCQVNAFFNLQLQECGSLDFSNSVVRDIVDMKPYGFTPELHSLNLSGLLLLGQFYIDWKANGVRALILEQKASHRHRSEQFRILKENYHTLGQYDAEDEAYVEFRRSEAKADLEEALGEGKFFRKWNAYGVYGFKWLIFDKIGLYATNPVRVLISMVVAYLFFVLIYFLLPFFIGNEIMPSLDHGDDLSQLEIAFYHSIVTFLTIGYGDYYPTGVLRWISGFEGFTGLFLIS
ncbi:MAG: two pore domain potassium channel family protein, partial [Phaeodactylibacter sp.]|nr:two pore domain potassium channel family protein [Phaeodactylibacter sp.]